VENKVKKKWEKPVIKSCLSINKTYGTTLPGMLDTNGGGNMPRS
jgi:hypothetical protein